MPTYEYECTKSGKRFERMQSMSDEPLKTCPECGGPVRRLITAGAGVISRRVESLRLTTTNSRPICREADSRLWAISRLSACASGRGIPRELVSK